ncbi:MAG: hypothetical protein GH151_11695 [Bacteroidetes bacterium]|nr:hypothetical protein [Bacteroidota bacterium]
MKLGETISTYATPNSCPELTAEKIAEILAELEKIDLEKKLFVVGKMVEHTIKELFEYKIIYLKWGFKYMNVYILPNKHIKSIEIIEIVDFKIRDNLINHMEGKQDLFPFESEFISFNHGENI